MKSLIFGTSLVLLGAVGANAQVVDTTNRAPLEVTPEREVMEEPAVDPATPAEYEPRLEEREDIRVDSTSLSPEDGDPRTSQYYNPQPAKQPEPTDTTRVRRPDR